MYAVLARTALTRRQIGYDTDTDIKRAIERDTAEGKLFKAILGALERAAR